MLIYVIRYSGEHQIVGNICNGSESGPLDRRTANHV